MGIRERVAAEMALRASKAEPHPADQRQHGGFEAPASKPGPSSAVPRLAVVAVGSPGGAAPAGSAVIGPPTGAEGPPTAAEVSQVQQAAGASQKAVDAAAQQAVLSAVDLYADQSGTWRLQVQRATGRQDQLLAESEEGADYIRAEIAKRTGRNIRPADPETLQATLRADAREARRIHETHTRIAPTEGGGVVVDLARDDGACVRVGPAGWRIEPQGAERYLRGPGVGELPTPELMDLETAHSTFEQFTTAAGVSSDDAPVLSALLCEYLRPGTPFPILELVGSAGARKTTLATQLIRIIDPTPTGAVPTVSLNAPDLMAGAPHRHVLFDDNASRLTPDQQDLACRVSTGGTLSGRKLYTQLDTVSMSIHKPLVFTGITSVITRSDARSRTITTHIRPAVGGYRSAADVDAEFRAQHPRLFGALLTLLVAGLQGMPTVKAQRAYTHRLVDFEQLGEAIHQARGQAPGWFGALLTERRRHDAAQVAAEDPTLDALLNAMRKAAEGATTGTTPSARSWMDNPGYVAQRAPSGALVVLATLSTLLQAVRAGTFGMHSGNDRVPDSEQRLRGFILHRQPTLEALGWAIEVRRMRSRTVLVMSRAADTQARP